MADAQHLPQGRHQAGDRHRKFHENRDNLAAAYGWINRAIPAAELDTFVDTIAKNIAALGAEVIAAVKRVLPTADLTAGLKEENNAWSTLLSTEKPAKMMTGAIANDLQSPEGERDVENLLRRIAATL